MNAIQRAISPPVTGQGRLLGALIGTVLWALLLTRPVLAGITEETLTSPQWTVHLVHPEDPPKGLVLYLPSARGWDPKTAARARELADQGHLIAGIDWLHPTPDQTPAPAPAAAQVQATAPSRAGAPLACLDLGEDLAQLARWLDQRESLPRDALPILLGEAEGAALVYGALLQSPTHRFQAAVTLNFCPRWPVALPPCRRAGLTDVLIAGDRLLPAAHVPSAWFLFTDPAGPACPAGETAAFATQVGNARLATGAPGAPRVPTSGENLSPLAALFQWLDPSIPDQVKLVSVQADTAGLPLVEVRAPREDPDTFAVMLSGDGGWAAIDRGVSARLAADGISTVGWDSLGYFWTARSPAEAARDLTRVIRHYQDLWHKERVILIGFSYGAEVLPFMANGLPDDLRPRVKLAALLSLGRTAMFQFHLSDWLDVERGEEARPVLPQVRALDWIGRLCVYGEDDDKSLCPELTGLGVEVKKIPGDHHFDEDYAGVAELILEAAASPTAPPAVGAGVSRP
jgi:type IV secretory pathway VirJ component